VDGGSKRPYTIRGTERFATSRSQGCVALTEAGSGLAELIIAAVPSIEKVRMVSSGTEAAMSAVRLARGFTGRDRIVKFAGNYHGHVDSLLVAAGSSAATLGVPNSPGITAGTARDTLVLDYKEPQQLEDAFAREGDAIAAVLLEPVVGNMGLVVPSSEFLVTARRLTAAHGALLVFDEVMTGFRLAYGGAQELLGVTPDLTTLGKIVAAAAGLPAWTARVGSMMTTFFQPGPEVIPVTGWPTASLSDTARYAAFFWGMIDRGIYLPCSQYEALFFSVAHTDDDIARTVAAARDVMAELAA
jgi:glutamate-1-semialdehyde aminotransferase